MSRDERGAPGRGSIRAQHVTKTFPKSARPSVDSVDLFIEPGSFVVLIGPSGCGKTTLLKMINRLIEPTSGVIEIDGVDIESMAGHELRRHIGYVIQQTGLFPHMRIEHNVGVVPTLLGWPKARISERTDELLTLVGLDPRSYRRRYPAQLSGGEQQRVGLARALAAEPALLLMDEPFGALDAITRTRLQQEMLSIQRRLRPTVVFVTHDIDEAVILADRIVVMREGRIVQAGTPLDIVLRPADDFVRELVGADDMMRRLSLVPASSVATPALAVGAIRTIDASASLRDVLALLLEEREERVAVVDDSGRRIGGLDLDSIALAAGGAVDQVPSR